MAKTDLTELDIRTKVEALAVEAGSMRSLARAWNMSPAYLSDFLNGRRGPGPQILEPLGLVMVVVYREGTNEGRRRQSKRPPAAKSPVKRPAKPKKRTSTP